MIPPEGQEAIIEPFQLSVSARKVLAYSVMMIFKLI